MKRKRLKQTATDEENRCNPSQRSPEGECSSSTQTPKPPKQDPEAFARRYQLEVFHRAEEENIIAFLKTGAGKTLIAVMLIKSYAHLLRKPQNNYAVFLVPTVVLVRQQANYLEIHTDLKVGQYWGDMGVDLWDREKWQKELNTHEVFVMTPQILLDNLRHCFFTLDTIRLLIFDECHHARKKHPYALIMHEFYHRINDGNGTNLPRIFGMTASPIYCKGLSSAADCASEVCNLEKTLNAKVYTLEDTTELEGVLVTPDMQIKYYDCRSIPNDLLQNLRTKLEYIKEKHTRFEERSQINGPILEKAREKIGKLHLTILFCAEEMGVWCAAKASEILLHQNGKNSVYDARLHKFVVNAGKNFLLDAGNACREILPSDKLWKCGVHLEQDVLAGFLSAKVQCLIQTLLYYRDTNPLRCIIFARRVIASMVMGNLLRSMNCFASIKSEYMAGSGSSLQSQTQKQHKQIIDAFREGKVNIIVATQVIEEGLDIQGCNLVIRFDLSDTVCSFIQSRGRARMQGSHYVLLVKRDDADQKRKLDKLLANVEIMRETALKRDLIPSHNHVDSMSPEEFFCVESGAIVTLNSSVALIDKYCSQLPGDRYYTPRPVFHMNKATAECIMELPTNCPISRIEIQGDINLLKQLACLEACKQLHKVGALTNYLLPGREEEDEDLQEGKENDDCEESFPLYAPDDFVSDWDFTMPKVLFYCYYLFFERDFEYTFPFQNVILLVKHALDPSVQNMKICLEVTKGAVSIQSEFAGTLELTSSEVEMATRFQVTVLRLLIHNKLDKLSGGMDLHSKTEISKNQIMYLLLPLVNTITSPKLGLSLIDWTCIRHAASIDLVNGCNKEIAGPSRSNHRILANKQGDLIQTACGMVPMDMLEDNIVETPHNGKVYCTLKVLKDLNAASRIVSEKCTSGEIKTYTEHFKNRYGITLRYQRQPLLLARPLFKVENFLLKRSKAENASASNSTVKLPPELCKLVCFPISPSILYTFSFLPSVMHRIESMLSAAQLQRIFSNQWPCNFSVPTTKVLEALTMKNCQECMSLETLETLGDAFLKYVASRYLFTTYNQKHEGQLTSKRKQIISNHALYKISCDRQIPGYIRNECFDVQQWIIPGQHLVLYCGNLQNNFHISENMHIKRYRTMKTKNVADVLEALIGACLETGGEIVALSFVKWLGIGMDFGIPPEMPSTRKLDTGFVCNVNVPYLESLLKYSFRFHTLLVESVTHASYKEPSFSGCYQRLEFLGDAVLDYLITFYFYKSHPGVSPGLLTDLRSAAVNNDCYAQAAVKCNLHQQLRHASNVLHNQITDFARCIKSSSASQDHFFGWTNTEVAVPKVLGDLIESIAGAVLVDSDFDTNLVWDAMKPLLEPLVTPKTIKYHPVRELHELCQKESYEYKHCFHHSLEEGTSTVKVEVTVKGDSYIETCDASNKRTAKKLAAEKVLKSLKAAGLHNH